MEVKPVTYPARSYKDWHRIMLDDMNGLVEQGVALAHTAGQENRLACKKSIAALGAKALANIVSYLEAIGVDEELRREAQESLGK